MGNICEKFVRDEECFYQNRVEKKSTEKSLCVVIGGLQVMLYEGK